VSLCAFSRFSWSFHSHSNRYDHAKNVEYFKRHIEETRKIAGGRPIWITEFHARGTDDEVKAFFDQVLPWMDASNDIHRYAYFMASPGSLVNPEGTDMSELGVYYNMKKTGNDNSASQPMPSDASNSAEPSANPSKRASEAASEKMDEPVCRRCRNGKCETFRCPKPPTLASVQDELESMGCRFVLWGWICDTTIDATIDASAVTPATKHELESSGCRFVLWGWICDKHLTSDERPSLDISAISEPSQHELEIQGCRFVLWGWICDKQLAISTSYTSRTTQDELEANGCRYVPWGWICDKLSKRELSPRAVQFEDRQDVSTPTSSDIEASGCRFTLWGWICDKQNKREESDILTLGPDAVKEVQEEKKCMCCSNPMRSLKCHKCTCGGKGARPIKAQPPAPVAKPEAPASVAKREESDILALGPDAVKEVQEEKKCMCCSNPMRSLKCHKCTCGGKGARPMKGELDAPSVKREEDVKATVPAPDSVPETEANEMTATKRKCCFFDWCWSCGAAEKRDEPATGNTSDCRLTPYGWVCDPGVPPAKRDEPAAGASMSKQSCWDTPTGVVCENCRFTLYGWVCDKDIPYEPPAKRDDAASLTLDDFKEGKPVPADQLPAAKELAARYKRCLCCNTGTCYYCKCGSSKD